MPSTKRSPIKAIVIGIICFAIGFVAAVFYYSTENMPKSFEVQLQELRLDSLQKIHDTTEAILLEKQQGKFDSLKMVGHVRDSLLVVKGKIEGAMIQLAKKPNDYTSLESLRSGINQMIASCDETIMLGTLDLLKPTNASFKTLIKEIKDKNEKLQKTVQGVATVSEIISVIIKILSLPILAPVNPPTTAT